MAVEYLKRASKTAATGEADVRATVQAMLDEIEAGGEAKAADYARRLDQWDGEIVVSPGRAGAGGGKSAGQAQR